LLLQLILMPILFVVQELTVRLGVTTGCGHGELILRHFGRGWAWLSVSTLVVACIGALITELAGLAGVGMMFGVPAGWTMGMTVTALTLIVWTGSHRSVERIAVVLGLFEAAFVWVAWRAHPDPHQVWDGLVHAPLGDHAYLYLMTANIGAVIMPWMVFYQQSAIVEKRLTLVHLRGARWETAVGAVITQVLMAAVLVATAATIGRVNPDAPLNTVQQISDALTPFLGSETGRLVFALGMSGAALVATIVVSLAAAWGVGEVTGYKRSLENAVHEAPWFYGLFTLALAISALVVASGVNLVNLSIGVQVVNALLLPVVLGLLFLLARRALPEAQRLKGPYAWVVGTVMALAAGFGLSAAIYELFD